MGGILLIFGTAVYILITIILLNQVDNKLAATVQDVIKVTRVNPQGQVSTVNLPSLDLSTNTYVQMWGRDGRIKSSSPGIAEMMQPLDPVGFESKNPVYRENVLNGTDLRVLTVPLQLGEHRIAILQVATSLTLVDSARLNLVNVLFLSAMVAVALAALGSWLVLGRSLAPLGVVTETAQAINRADDLSRRIPYKGPSNDEIGSLIESFNQTLERLENLFTSQQRFLADVSHELRTPLTVIKGNVDLMRRMKHLDEESLTSIDQEAGRLTRLVGGADLVDTSGIREAGSEPETSGARYPFTRSISRDAYPGRHQRASKAGRYRPGAGQWRPRPIETGVIEPGWKCNPVHAAGWGSVHEPGHHRRTSSHHRTRHGAGDTRRRPAIHLRAFLSCREVAHTHEVKRFWAGTFDRAMDRREPWGNDKS